METLRILFPLRLSFSKPGFESWLLPSSVEIHYTLDGSEPTLKSPVYTEKLSLAGNKILKLRLSHPVRLPVLRAVDSSLQPAAAAGRSHLFLTCRLRTGWGPEKKRL